MDDSFDKKLEEIKTEAPVSVKADPVSLLYGVIFIVLGVLLIDFGGTGIGLLMVVVGAIGVLAGAATFFWKSPRVKVVQAIDNFLIAGLLLVFAMVGDGGEFMDNPLIILGLAGFMLWAGYDDLKEYWHLSKFEKEQVSLKHQ